MASVWGELKRRNVVRVAIAYAVVAWIMIEISATTFPMLKLPEWAATFVTVLLIIGFPVALVFAWAFELTPEGIKKEKDVDRSESITHVTGRKLDFAIIGVLVIAVGFLLANNFYDDDSGVAGDQVNVTERQSIAVIPFVNMSDDSDHFSDGLSEELLNLLARIPGLKVPGRTSSFSFKGRNDAFREIGAALDVEHVLEGSVRRSGDYLRITAQLIKVDDGYHVWSETYDRKMADIFAIQDEVAAAIIKSLELRLIPVSKRPTNNSEAYAYYLEALGTLYYTERGLRETIGALDNAISLDPAFARAHEYKASVYWNVAGVPYRDIQDLKKLSYESARLALDIDPELVVAGAFATSAKPSNWTWTAEIEGFERALEAEPKNMNLINALVYDYWSAGYFRDALALARRQLELDPVHSDSYFSLAMSLELLGRHSEALENFRRCNQLGDNRCLVDIGNSQWRSKDHAAATKTYEEVANRQGIDSALIAEFIENMQLSGADASALVRFAAGLSDDEPMTNNFFVHFLPQVGYISEYWRFIEQIADGDHSVWSNAEPLFFSGMIKRDTGFTSHPAFLEYHRTSTLFDLWDKRGPPDFCKKTDGQWICQ